MTKKHPFSVYLILISYITFTNAQEPQMERGIIYKEEQEALDTPRFLETQAAPTESTQDVSSIPAADIGVTQLERGIIFKEEEEALKLPEKERLFKITGYIKAEGFIDSRQIIAGAEGQDLAFPVEQSLDFFGNDINAQGCFNLSTVETNIRMEAAGPRVGRFETLGILQCYWYGTIPSGVINTFTQYEAFVQVFDKKLIMTAGLTYHPIFVLECYPRTIGFNAGFPIEVFARDPQLTVNYKTNKFKFTASALGQLTFANLGPNGFSNAYQRNAITPMWYGSVEYKPTDKLLFGSGLSFKREVPRLVTNEDFKTDTGNNSFSATWYAALNYPNVSIWTKANWTQNAVDLSAIGGYTVKCVDPCTDKREYTDFSYVGYWMDVEIQKHKNFLPGIWFGAMTSLGANSQPIIQQIVDPNGNVEDTVYSFGANIANLVRISPRFRWKRKNTTFGCELEYTRASYGTIGNDGNIHNRVPVANTRFMFAFYYDI